MKNIVFFGGSSQIALNLNKILKKKYTTHLVSRSKNNVKNCINIKNYSKTEIKKSFKEINKKADCIIIFNGFFSFSSFLNFNQKHFFHSLKVNFLIPLKIANVVIKNNFINKDGSIIFISSIAAKENKIGNFNYSVSKNALDFAAKIIFKELMDGKVRISTINLGIVNNKMSKGNITLLKLKKIKVNAVKIKKIAQNIDFIIKQKKKYSQITINHIEKKCL